MAEKKENLEKVRREVEDSKTRLEQDEHQLIRTENKIAKLGRSKDPDARTCCARRPEIWNISFR